MKTAIETAQKTALAQRISIGIALSGLFMLGVSFGLVFITSKGSDTTVVQEPQLTANIVATSKQQPTLMAIDEKSAEEFTQPTSTSTKFDRSIPEELDLRTIYVNNANTFGVYDGKTPRTAYLHLNDALLELVNKSGVTIEIAQGAGIYEETFTTGPDAYGCAIGGDDNGITNQYNIIKAKSGQKPILRCTKANGFRLKDAQWIRVEGLTFLSSMSGNRNGLNIGDSQNIQFAKNSIPEPYANGITVNFSSNVLIENNTITGALNSIFLYQANNTSIKGNTIGHSRCTGVYLLNSSSTNLIQQNLVYSTGLGCDIFGYAVGGNGIRIESSSNSNTIESNTVYNSLAGRWFWQGNWYVTNGNGVVVLSNSVNNTLKNSIVSNSGIQSMQLLTGGSMTASYNDFWQPAGPTSSGNINVDPMFINTQGDNFHVKCGSPTIDAGDPSSKYSLEPMPNGRRINLGYDGNTAQAQTSIPASECSLPIL